MLLMSFFDVTFVVRCHFLEREATEELEALTTLCRQLEAWRDETESDLTVNQRMSEKMKTEKKALADEKRQLVSKQENLENIEIKTFPLLYIYFFFQDMIIYNLSNEVWKLESKLELFQKQMEIKNAEMEQVNDKVFQICMLLAVTSYY